MHISASQIMVFLLSVSILLFFSKMFGELFSKIKQPAIIGEILAGIILGPTVFGMLMPGTFNFIFPKDEVNIALDGITNLAVIMLLLVSGMEVDLSVVLKQGKAAVFTTLFGIITPFTLAFGTAYFFPSYMGMQDGSPHLVFALFMGTALSISALPVIAKTLMDLNMFKSEIGIIIIASAMFIDVIGWLIFSIVLSMLGVDDHGLSFLQKVIFVIGFTFFFLFIGRRIFNWIIVWINKHLSVPGSILNFIFIMGFLGAAFTQYIGVHAVLGAFIIGIAVGDSANIKESTREMVQQFVTNLFAPLFFASIGLRVNFITSFDLPLVLIILALAFTGTVTGAGLGARMAGMKRNDALIIGFGMNSRGAMEIILGMLAFQYGIIQENVFVALVIMALVTSMASAPFMNFFMKERRSFSFARLLNPRRVLLTNYINKEEIIEALVDEAVKHVSADRDLILNEVMTREKEIPTGIANYLAIPHAKIAINKPVVIAALNKSGIDFEAPDGKLSRAIFLLLTPVDKTELQLQLLAEIVKKFRNQEKVDTIVASSTKEQFIERLLSA